MDLRDLVVGPEALHLDLSLGTWAADGLLAIFFFVAGLELKREFVAGDLRDPRRAALPVAAAVGGMTVPALIYVAVASAGGGSLDGWAIPTATDIAFALAILAVISTHLPVALRTFLLTLAVVDDLLAITVIAVFYTDDLDLVFLALAILPIGVFAVLVQRRVQRGVPAAPDRRGRLDARARLRGARDRGRRAAGLHGAGPPPRRPHRCARPGRALRAPGAPGLGRVRGPGIRVLRLRRGRRRLRRPGRRP